MSKADVIYNDAVKKIQDEGTWNKGQEVRAKYADGVLAHAKSIFGIQFEFRNGLMPLLTAKKVFSKTAAKEMMLFWVQQTVKQDDFERENCKVWDSWFLANRTLGRSYAYQFESRPKKEVTKVAIKQKEKHNDILPTVVVSAMLPINTSNPSKYIGQTYSTKDYGDYIVVDISDDVVNRKATIQFVETGYVKVVDIATVIKGKNTPDNYARFYSGVGYLGNPDSVKNFNEDEKAALYRRWYYMLRRCYEPSHSEYKNYGAKGVFVEERWHSFENYLRDVRWIPQYFIAKQDDFLGWSIDKDYYAANYYGKDSAVWIKDGENLSYRNTNQPIYLIKPNGEKELYLSFSDAEKDYGLSNLCKVVKGTREHIRHFKAEEVEVEEGYVYRYELSRNQVVDLINGIKENPSSRRHMTCFWNDKDVRKKALQECAWATEWNVRDGKLDLILIQRSGDIGLGVPFNWIQYWTLLNMVAQVCELEVGDFIHQMGNLHYYDRHEATLMEQIEAEQYELPTFKINTEVKDFFDFTHEDIQFINYQSGKFMPMEVAI